MQITNLKPEDIEQLTAKVNELRKDNPDIKMQIYHESRYDRREWKEKWKFSREI